jgi:hypothetical protein
MTTMGSWAQSVRFALARNFQAKPGSPFISYEANRIEKISALLLHPLYFLLNFVGKYIKQPIAILLFTVIACLLAIVVFYDFKSLMILGRLFPYQTCRFLLFAYIEIIWFSMGCRALGRFSNKPLIALWKSHQLQAFFL